MPLPPATSAPAPLPEVDAALAWRRCFLALAPDAPTRAALVQLRLPDAVQPVAPADLHLTLAFLGAITPAQGQALIQALLADTHALLRNLGLPVEARPFQPHITLGRYRRRAVAQTDGSAVNIALPAARFTALALYTSLHAGTVRTPRTSGAQAEDHTGATPHYRIVAQQPI
ncbi:hypothetical protein NJI34_08800 [Pseudomonas sp. S 311-6]|uniref:2'-5' RNA ligase family protein n=1 Tax=Kerstersia gyiorum TaxID=206506 RepID=UPI002096E64E|nr:hypothetical protein [Pseudomonas sp. S 311-6]